MFEHSRLPSQALDTSQVQCSEVNDNARIESCGMESCGMESCGMESCGMESLWATLKKELVRDRHFRTHDEAHTAIFEWIEVWYHRIRIHGSLGYVSPEAFEATERVG